MRSIDLLESIHCNRLDDLVAELYNPQFEKAGKVHDWRNYVPTKVQEIWKILSLRERIIVYIMARQQAFDEEWD